MTATLSPAASRRASVLNRLSARPSPPVIMGVSLTGPFFVLMGALVIYPIVELILVINESPGFAANVSQFFDLSFNLTALRVTFVDSVIVTVIVVVFGAVVAWSLVTTRRQYVRLILLTSVVAPLMMNSILKVFAFTVLLQRTGIVNHTLMALHIIHQPLSLIYNQFAVSVGMVYWLFPYAVLPLYVTFSSLDPDLANTAESLGASRSRALFDACLPLAWGGVFATIVIDYVLCLGFFLMPLMLGGPSVPFTATVVWEDVTDYSTWAAPRSRV